MGFRQHLKKQAWRSDGKPNIDCRNILQSSVVPEVNKGAGGQNSMDAIMILGNNPGQK